MTMPPDLADRFDPDLAARLQGADPASAGGLPAFLGIQVTECSPGVLTARVDVVSSLLTPFGAAHGGVLAALVDHVLGAVCYPVISRGAWAATTEFKVNFLAPVREGILEARAEIITFGTRIAVVRIEARSNGALVGLAQGTVTVRAPVPRPT
jgi:uncharacterized protein (TIGR00369 family)